MRHLILTLCVSIQLVTAGCSDQSAQTHPAEAATYPVKLVFHDFNDSRATLTIDGDVVVDDVLHGDNAEATSVSLIKTVELRPTSRFRLQVEGLVVDRSIVVNADTKLIYINPHERPFIETSNSERISLE